MLEHLQESMFELGRLVGDDLLAFMLAMSPSDLRTDRILDGPRTEVLDKIWTKAVENTEQIGPEWGPIRWKTVSESALIEAFCTYDESLKTSVATNYHLHAGGLRPDVGDATSLKSCLQTIAIDTFPARLVGSGRTLYSWSGADQHPLTQAVRTHLRDDTEPLHRLLIAAWAATDPADRRGRDTVSHSDQMTVDWSTGGGGSLYLHDIGSGIISSVILENDLDDRVLIQVSDAINIGLAQARRLAAGESVAVKTAIGLGGFTLADDVPPIEVVGGLLRRPTVLDRRLNTFAAKPDIVLEIELPVRYTRARLSPPARNNTDILSRFIADNEQRKPFLPELIAHGDEVKERIRRIRFAMILASPDQQAVLEPVWRFTQQFNPIIGRGSGTHQPDPEPNVVHTTPPPCVDTATATEIAAWVGKLDRLPDSLKVGRRRLLQAATERSDPFDKFIDAVIVWETMFGADSETSFRVTGAMALLLEPSDIEARKMLHRKLSELYGHRSKLVHGAVGHELETKAFKAANVPAHANEAIRYAINCFKKILDEPQLLPLDSAARSKRILLGF